MRFLTRWQTWLAGLWAGMLLAIGALAAPALFAVLERAQAGLAAGRLFTLEARISLVLSVLLLAMEYQRLRKDTWRLNPGRWSPELLLTLFAFVLTAVSHMGLHPMIQAAKAGQVTALSFAALHGMSSALYALKTVAVLVLFWRCTSSVRRR
jgi:hypothetical protein